MLNTDAINKIVAKDLSIPEKDVALVNQFYWFCNTEHLRTLNLQPLNFTGIGYVRHSQFLIHRKIYKLIIKLRLLKTSARYKEGGFRKNAIVNNYQNRLRELLKVRNIKTYIPKDE